jgi:protein-disulfide isomerase
MNEETKSGSPFMLPVAIILAGALIGVGFYLSKRPTDVKVFSSDSNVVKGINIRPVTEEDYILGNPNAPVVIVEYSDTECPYCKTFHNTMHRLINEYGKDGKLAWVYRQFPIDSLHSKARKESEATECAGELGGSEQFWNFLDEIFNRTSSNNSLDPAELPKIAEDIGLDVEKFNSCLSSGRLSQKVQSDWDDAITAGAGGTPYNILITRKGDRVAIEGARPYDMMKTIIDAALLDQGIVQQAD